MKRSRIVAIILTLLFCVSLFPMPALAANSIEIFGNTWNTSTYAKVVENKIETDGAGPDDFNIYWDAENAKLTLKDVDMDIENLSITADLENLQIDLIGKNTFYVSKNINGDFYFISNTGKMSITGAQDALLDIDVTLNNNVMGNIGIISADGSITNSTSLDLLLSVPEESSFTAKLYCILSGWSRGSQGGLENSGTITAKTERMSLSGSSSDIYAIYIIGGPMHNSESGTLDLTGVTTNGSVACLAGNYIPYESSWTNDGTILASATAYGGNYPGFTGSAFSNHACAISVYSNYDALMMTNNGYMDLYAVNYGQNKGYEYAIGMEFESSATNFINKGTIDIQALQGYTFGMYLPTLEEDSVLKNYGDISILVTTDGEFLSNVDSYASATGILLTLSNYDSNPEPKITNLSLESGSSLEITARPADNDINEDMGYDDIYYNLCAAIQMQKIFVYGDPYGGEAPMEIILSDDLVIVEEDGEYDGGEPIALLESFYLPDLYLYINTIGNYFTEEESGDTFSVPSKHIQILPKIPGTAEISGNPKVGNEVTAKLSGVPDSIPVTYQWQSGDSSTGTFTDIAGATNQTYKITENEKGKYLRVVITPVAGNGYAGDITATSTSYVAVNNPISIYPPIIVDSTGGTTTKNVSYPRFRDEVVLTPSPDMGYKLDSITLSVESGKNIDLIYNGDGTYSFIQPDEVVTVTVKYSAGGCGGTAAEGCPSAKYKDIDTNQWYHYYIDYVLRNHLMIGTSDTEFSPDDTLTRAEAVMVLWRLAGEPMVEFDMDFEDVPELQWYTEAIRWSASEKVIEGYGDGTFGTEDPITKEQLSAILWRYAKSEGYDVFGGEDFDLSVFTDESSISDYAYDAVKWACGADIIRGNGDGTLNPAGDMKRSEFSTMMMYFIENIIR